MTEHASGFGGALTPGDRAVVLAIDMMAAYFTPGSDFCLPSRGCLDSAARVVESARGAGVPVIHTRVEFAPSCADGGVFMQKVPALRALAGGGDLGRIMSEVDPLAGELVFVNKNEIALLCSTNTTYLTAHRVDCASCLVISSMSCVMND